jgi:cobalt-zinc-cadmium efflux system protein
MVKIMPHSHDHDHNHSVSNNLGISFVINTIFLAIEIIGGIYTNSQAILSDALHDFGDSLSIGLSYYFEKKSNSQSNEKYNYGLKRLSLMASLISAGVLMLGSVLIIWNSVPRLFNPEPVKFGTVVILACLGVALNGFVFLKTRGGHNHNEKMVSLHFLEDTLGWVGVLIAGVINLYYNLPILDPIISIAVAVFTFYRVIINLKSTLNIFMQATPDNLERNKVVDIFKSNSNVIDFHDLNIWSLDGSDHILSVHLVVKDLAIDVKHNIKHSLEDIGIIHSTLELELIDDNCHKKI